ncbi:MAG: PLP-dependent aspartate aminotransferase family protein [Candidatus Moraniibacteriota bacterium]
MTNKKPTDQNRSMMGMRSADTGNWGVGTSILHAGYDADRSEGAAVVPYFPCSTYAFSSAEKGAEAFELALAGSNEGELIYARVNHPNAQILEDRLKYIEPGTDTALIFNSGMSAIFTSILALLPKEKTLVFSDPLYGGTYHFFETILGQKFGYNVQMVDTSDIEKTGKLFAEIGSNLGMVFLETPANPTLRMTDIKLVAKMAKTANPNCFVMVDNTFLGLFQAVFKISRDVDFVVYSATKYIGGHSTVVAGALMAREEMRTHIPSIKEMRIMAGTILPPYEAWTLLQQIKTYPMRMRKQAKNATIIAKALQKNQFVKKVIHPSLLTENDPAYEIYKRQCTGPGAIISFYLYKDQRKYASLFLDAVKQTNIIMMAVSLGGVETLIEHPASMTHSEMPPEVQRKNGISESLIRLSVGIEDPEDIIAALIGSLNIIDFIGLG